MTSTKRLRSINHSTAHHAVSGLCYVHPYLGSICRDLGYASISVNLLSQGFSPSLKTITEELKLSTSALREFFRSLLHTEKVLINELETAEAVFFFARGRWPSACVVRVHTCEGKEIEICVDSSGKKGEILHESS